MTDEKHQQAHLFVTGPIFECPRETKKYRVHRLLTIPASMSSGRNWPLRVQMPAGWESSNFGLFRHLECVINLDAEVSYGTFQLGMTKQQLNGSQVFGTSVDQ
jgi:hypothetical protein